MREREIKKIKIEKQLYKKYTDGEIEELKLNSIGLNLEDLNKKKHVFKLKKKKYKKEKGKISNKSSSSSNFN